MDDIPIPAAKSMFDQQPIGNGAKMMLDQYPADFDPSKIEAKTQPLPLGKRLGSKVWKVRKQALQELLKIVSSENHQQFCEHQSTIIKLLSDSNIQCQFLSAKILFQYLQKQQSYSGQVKPIIKNVIEKLMTIQKEDIQNLSLEIVYWLVDHSFQQVLMNELNEYLLNKNPKIISASLKSIQMILHNYGIKKVQSLQLFCKNLKLLADAARPMAKPQTVELYKEIFKWMGQQVLTSFVINPEVKQQLLKWVKTYQIQPMQIKRGLKKGQQGKKINPLQQEQQSDIPVDILHHFDSRWVDTVLEIQKWQQKKEHLEEFIKKTRVGAIVPRQTSHYITLVKRLCSENNINLLQCGFKIVKNLCKGLKKAFAISCKSFLSYVYLKLKDNKAMIVDETLSTLKAMTYSITLQDMQEQIKMGLKDKSPQMRLNTLKLLKDISAKKDPKTTKIMKSLLDSLVALTNDSASDVRDIALSVLCKLKEHYGMLFFQDKLESLPSKKVNQIRATFTVGGDQNQGSKMEIEEMGFNSLRSNASMMSETSIKGVPKQPKNLVQKKKPLQSVSQTQLNVNNKINNKPQQTAIEKKVSHSSQNFQKKASFTSQNAQKKPIKNQMPIIREEKHYRNQISQEEEIMNIRNQQWPIVPTPGHVLRLINLFTKLGEPFTTLATPFKLKFQHFQILENSNGDFLTQNADLLLKWVLWRIQIENNNIIQKLLSVIIHLMYLLKNIISNDQTILILSNLSSLLQSDFWNHDMLKFINGYLVEISFGVRERVFNFWISALNSSCNDNEYCDRILSLMRNTFQNQGFSCEQICTMARTQAVVKNKRFVAYLFERYNRQLLKVSGFTLEQFEKMTQQWVLKQSQTQFSTQISVEQRMAYFEIFRKTSAEAMQQIKKLQESVSKKQLMPLHIKLMETIMIPCLNQKLQPLNIYNYFKLFTSRITKMCDSRGSELDLVTPHLRNLMRLTVFFLIDLSQSKLDNKDQLTRTVNKIILVFLDKMPAQHLLQVMTMLLNYTIKNNLNKRLWQLLMKCIGKSVKSQSFNYKTQKNVKLIFNFFVQLTEQLNINEDQNLVRQIKFLFSELMTNYKELCSQIVSEKIAQYSAQGFKCKQIEVVFQNFINFLNRKQDGERLMNQIFNPIEPKSNVKIDAKITQNLQHMSNLQENSVPLNQSHLSNFNKSQQGPKIRETTNIQRKTEHSLGKVEMNKIAINQGIQMNENSEMGNKILQDRRKLQNYQQLCQSWEGLVKIRDNIEATSNNQQQLPNVTSNQEMNV